MWWFCSWFLFLDYVTLPSSGWQRRWCFCLLMLLFKNSLVLSFCWILILCRIVRIWILPSRIGTFCCNRFFRLWCSNLSRRYCILILWYTVSRIFLLILCLLIVISPICRLQLAFIWIIIAKLCICFELFLRCFEEIITVFFINNLD